MKLEPSNMLNAATWLKVGRTVLSGHDSLLLTGQVWNNKA
jgi:hypothetical protein